MNSRMQLSRTAALAAIIFAVGCGGGGGSTVHLNQANLEFTGADTGNAVVSVPTPVPAAGGTEVMTSSGTAVLPSGVPTDGGTVDPGTIVAIIPAGTGLTGTFPAGTQMGVNGVMDSGAAAGADGKLDQNVALPVEPGNVGTLYTLTFPQAVLPTRVLHVGSFVFTGRFYVKPVNGVVSLISPLPLNIGGALPNDGENAVGSYVNCLFNPLNAGRSATLVVDYGTGFRLKQTVVIDARGRCTFRNLFTDAQNVPPTGVQTVSLAIGDL